MSRLAGASSLVAVARLLPRAVAAWWNDNELRLGASVAYYTLFAIAPILLVAIAVAGAVFGDEAVRGEIVGQIDGLVGRDGGAAVQALLEGARSRKGNLVAALVGTVTSVLAACGVFLELQAALNTVWRVKPAAPPGLLRSFLVSRARSFGLVLAIGFLLLVSLALSAGLAGVGAWLAGRVPGLPTVLSAFNWLLSVAVTAVLFGLLFKVLPDVELTWPDVAVGGLVTAVLFTVGKQLIGLYLGQSGSSSYGAVGSVVVLLLWVYYSSQILLIGAEFTRLYTERTTGGRPAPSEFGRPA